MNGDGDGDGDGDGKDVWAMLFFWDLADIISEDNFEMDLRGLEEA